LSNFPNARLTIANESSYLPLLPAVQSLPKH
jgi:hypothetical protein